jgi:hypothetical protein
LWGFLPIFWPSKVRRQVYGIDISTTNSGVAYADSFVLKEHHRQALPKWITFSADLCYIQKGAITKLPITRPIKQQDPY